MPAGAQIHGDHGLLQIDESFFCLTVAAHGTLASSTWFAGPMSGADLYRITCSADQPTFGLYLPAAQNQIGGVFATTWSGGVWTVDFLVDGPGASRVLSGIHWFAFDRPPAPPPSGQGMLVWDAAGKLVFSSLHGTKTPTSNFVTGRKYAGVGGYVGLADELQVQTDEQGNDFYAQAFYAYGFNCPDGGLQEGYRQIFFQTGSGNGSGPSGFYQYGVNQPLIGIDITEFVS